MTATTKPKPTYQDRRADLARQRLNEAREAMELARERLRHAPEYQRESAGKALVEADEKYEQRRKEAMLAENLAGRGPWTERDTGHGRMREYGLDRLAELAKC
jgi:hypothetical protein